MQGISRRAVQHWTGHNAPPERPLSRNSAHSGYARTVIGSASAPSEHADADGGSPDHHLLCDNCDQVSHAHVPCAMSSLTVPGVR